MALGFAALVLGGSLDLAVKPDAIPSASTPSVIKDYMRTQPPYEETAYLRWLRFQLRAIGGASAPAARYPVGGQFDVEQFTSEDGSFNTGAPR